MSEVAMTKPKRTFENLKSKFFITVNYKDVPDNLNVCTEQLKNVEQHLTQKINGGNSDVIFASMWQEIGKNGNLHVHGIFIYKSTHRKRFTQFQEALRTYGILVGPDTQECKDPVAAYEYRLKEGKDALWAAKYPDIAPYFFRVGDEQLLQPNGQRGRRNDIKRAIDKYGGYRDIVLNEPDVAARGRHVILDFFAFKAAAEFAIQERYVMWIYGGPGSGKSRQAHELARELSNGMYYTHPPGSIKWWDGYDGEKAVIIDDLRWDQLKDCGGIVYLLRLFDRYPMRVEVKGGSAWWLAKWIIVTCPVNPVAAFTAQVEGEYSKVNENIGQLIRRLTQTVELTLDGDKYIEVDKTEQFREDYLIRGGNFEPVTERRVIGKIPEFQLQ